MEVSGIVRGASYGDQFGQDGLIASLMGGFVCIFHHDSSKIVPPLFGAGSRESILGLFSPCIRRAAWHHIFAGTSSPGAGVMSGASSGTTSGPGSSIGRSGAWAIAVSSNLRNSRMNALFLFGQRYEVILARNTLIQYLFDTATMHGQSLAASGPPGQPRLLTVTARTTNPFPIISRTSDPRQEQGQRRR